MTPGSACTERPGAGQMGAAPPSDSGRPMSPIMKTTLRSAQLCRGTFGSTGTATPHSTSSARVSPVHKEGDVLLITAELHPD